MMDVNIVLFDEFETLDAFGPAEIFGKLPQIYNLKYVSWKGGIVTSSQQIQTVTCSIQEVEPASILLIPGGQGTRTLVKDAAFIELLKDAAVDASYVLTVCTGSALLAKTGLLNGYQATSNKRAFDWVQALNAAVVWQRQARWVVDRRFYTSSGVSAGMDMTLGFLADRHGQSAAEEIAAGIEYSWHADAHIDPFA